MSNRLWQLNARWGVIEQALMADVNDAVCCSNYRREFDKQNRVAFAVASSFRGFRMRLYSEHLESWMVA
jgi:hypothetical protein